MGKNNALKGFVVFTKSDFLYLLFFVLDPKSPNKKETRDQGPHEDSLVIWYVSMAIVEANFNRTWNNGLIMTFEESLIQSKSNIFAGKFSA